MGLTIDTFRYFSHDADMRNDIKIRALRRKFGNTGYAVWCYLLETLTDSENFELDFEPDDIELLAADFGVTPDELVNIVEYCKRIRLLQQRDGKIYSERHKERFEDMLAARLKKSLAGKLGMQRRWGQRAENNSVITQLPDVITPDNKLEKKGEDKNREEKKGIEKNNISYSYQDIADLWNSACNKLPKIQKVTEGRKQKIKCRFEEFGKDVDEAMSVYQAILGKVATSDFLCGDNNSNWVATFDWLFENSRNWVKVSEGNYDNNRGAKSAPVTASNNLGVGEYMDNSGKRTYGTGKANIPMSAPPRPSENYTWDESTHKWIML